MKIYHQPKYYEIAFSFVNAKKQVDNFEKLIKKFSKTRVKRFLDIACGPSLQLREIAKRGYSAIGLDLNPEMLKYLKDKACQEGLKIKTIKADMVNFELKEKVDFAFIMMGSLTVGSNEEFLNHLDSVAASLNGGGLYFIQNQPLTWLERQKQSWTMKESGITVKTIYESQPKSITNQIYTEKITMLVNDRRMKRKFVHSKDVKVIFPQEFKALLKLNGKFEFLGWWKGNANNWRFNDPLEKANDLKGNIIILRKK